MAVVVNCTPYCRQVGKGGPPTFYLGIVQVITVLINTFEFWRGVGKCPLRAGLSYVSLGRTGGLVGEELDPVGPVGIGEKRLYIV